MITITSLCPICLKNSTPCERKIWTVRGTNGPIEDFSDIYLVGTIIGINQHICIGSAFIGRMTRKDIAEIAYKLYYDLGFKYFYTYRQPSRTFLMGDYVSEGFFKGSWRADLQQYLERRKK